MHILTNTGPQAAATTMWSANVADLDSVSVKVNAIVGSTITVESSADNSSWSTITTGGEAYDSVGGVAPNAGVITVAGRYRFPADTNYLRFRVSTYVGPGNVDIDVDYSTETPRKLTRMLVTGLVATGNSLASALPIQGRFNQFATVAASTGAILPAGLSLNDVVAITNGGASALSVYPPNSAAKINGGSGGAANSLAAGATAQYVSDGAGNFWRF